MQVRNIRKAIILIVPLSLTVFVLTMCYRLVTNKTNTTFASAQKANGELSVSNKSDPRIVSRLSDQTNENSLDRILIPQSAKAYRAHKVTFTLNIKSNNDLSLTLKNNGPNRIKVIKPQFDYSFWLHFYYPNGKRHKILRQVAVNHLNVGLDGIVELGPNEFVTDYVKSEYWQGIYAPVKGRTLIVAEYDGSGYPVQKLPVKVKSQLLLGKMWSNSSMYFRE